ncbi:hypothetical protein B7P43_G17126 [Cryptotermes secundus]|uniref:Uncharacterized protein n=1 Tax=Cryptotermes secundus TaxID=105785 RepID=A0A2J7QCU9_9NEOP|nr:hypothetical protein B7P43_G17126 [Cryptotermes secundus]
MQQGCQQLHEKLPRALETLLFEPLHPRKGRKTANGIAKSPVGLRQDKDWTLWRGRPPPKRKKGNGPYGRNR